MKRFLPTFLLLLFLFSGLSDAQRLRRNPMFPIAGGITEVGSGSQRVVEACGDTAISFSANVVSGNLLITTLSGYTVGTRPTAPTVADSVGTTYTVKWSLVSANEYVGIAYGIANGSGANTVTWTPNVGAFDYPVLTLDEFSGVNSTPLDVDGGTGTGTSTSPQRAITTGVNNALIITVLDHNTSPDPTITAVSGTIIGESEDTDFCQPAASMFHIVGTAGSYTEEFSTSISVVWGVMSVSFKPV